MITSSPAFNPEILSGLNAGEMVIINPTDQVREGIEVKPVAVHQGSQ